MSARTTTTLALLALAALGASAPAAAAPASPASPAEGRRRVAVLEYRAGLAHDIDVAQRLADELRRTAALVVTTPADARRKSARLDGDLARCAGDAACVAKIGGQLDTDEVLLVAMSQLGDVVLALQRINVEDAKIETQLSAVVPEGGDVTPAQIDEWLKKLYPPDVFKRYGSIVVSANVDGARVLINGTDRGLTPLGDAIRVRAPQSYRVDLSKDGHAPFSARIDVVPDASVEVNAQLPLATQATPWYKRWYTWAIFGGVVAAGAATGTAFYLTRPDDLHNHGTLTLPLSLP